MSDRPKYRPNLYELQSQAQNTFSEGVTVCLFCLIAWITVGSAFVGILAFANFDPVTAVCILFAHVGIGFVGYDSGLKYYLEKAKKILDSYECRSRN